MVLLSKHTNVYVAIQYVSYVGLKLHVLLKSMRSGQQHYLNPQLCPAVGSNFKKGCPQLYCSEAAASYKAMILPATFLDN